jgi:hypothetical protein
MIYSEEKDGQGGSIWILKKFSGREHDEEMLSEKNYRGKITVKVLPLPSWLATVISP